MNNGEVTLLGKIPSGMHPSLASASEGRAGQQGRGGKVLQSPCHVDVNLRDMA